MGEGFGHHSGQASEFCGLGDLRYDHYVDIDRASADFERIIPDSATHGAWLNAAVNTGWEACTQNHVPSLLKASRRTGVNIQHDSYVDASETPASKALREDQTFCDDNTSRAVSQRYEYDYRVLRSIPLPFQQPHICLTSSE